MQDLLGNGACESSGLSSLLVLKMNKGAPLETESSPQHDPGLGGEPALEYQETGLFWGKVAFPRSHNFAKWFMLFKCFSLRVHQFLQGDDDGYWPF